MQQRGQATLPDLLYSGLALLIKAVAFLVKLQFLLLCGWGSVFCAFCAFLWLLGGLPGVAVGVFDAHEDDLFGEALALLEVEVGYADGA